MNIAILGGYGNAGRLIARHLVPHPSATLTLLGRDAQKAAAVADALSHELNQDVRGGYADASDKTTLVSALREVDLLVVAASSMAHVQTVAEAALETKTDYLDIQLSSPDKREVLHGLEPSITEQGRCFITDGGYHPGVPAALVRYAARHLPDLKRATVGGAFALDWGARTFSEATMSEFVTELKTYDPSIFVEGRWMRRMMTTRTFDFGMPFGKKYCVPMHFEEMRSLPDLIPTLRETGFFIAGFGPVVDYLIMPLCLVGLTVAPRFADRIAAFFVWGLRRFAGSTDGAVLVLDAEGIDVHGPVTLQMRLAHDDPYVFTALPVVACLRQYLDGGRKPGLWTQAHFVDPDRFIDDLQEMGVAVEITHSKRFAAA